jgi:uncharacterized membrane protein (UPF0127 family)
MMIHFVLMISLVACGGGGGGGGSASLNAPEIGTTPPITVDDPNDPLRHVQLETASGARIVTTVSYRPLDQEKGLAGVRSSEFNDNEAMLFFYFADAPRVISMKNTFFPVDIYYLDEDLTIVDVVWNLPWYQGTIEEDIPLAPSILSRHILELKAGASRLSVGDQLSWKSTFTLGESEARMKANLGLTRSSLIH